MNEVQPPVPATPPAPPERKGLGCLAWGLIILLVLFLMGGLAVFLVIRYVRQEAHFLVTDILETKPLALEQAKPSKEEREALDKRITSFMQALDAGSNAAPLVMNSADLNNWIASSREGDGSANPMRLTIEGDVIKAQVSVPLNDVQFPLIDLKGRYLNGSASVHIALTNGMLWANLESFEARGKSLPKEFLPFLQSQNLAQSLANDPTNGAGIRRLESVVVKDGNLILTPKPGR